MPTGIELIVEERRQQYSREGWTDDHDDTHAKGELANAAACYLQAALLANLLAFDPKRVPALWPWGDVWWRPHGGQVRILVKAGALIAAEIDRLQRLEAEGKAKCESANQPRGARHDEEGMRTPSVFPT